MSYHACICKLEQKHVLYSFKGGSDPSHFIFEINVGKSQNLNDDLQLILSRSKNFISESFYYPTISDNDFKNKMALVCTTLKKIHLAWNSGTRAFEFYGAGL